MAVIKFFSGSLNIPAFLVHCMDWPLRLVVLGLLLVLVSKRLEDDPEWSWSCKNGLTYGTSLV